MRSVVRNPKGYHPMVEFMSHPENFTNRPNFNHKANLGNGRRHTSRP
jgi:hypothetical protein